MGKRKQRRSLRRSGSGEFHSCPPAVLLQTCWEGTLTEWCFVMECSNMDVLCIFVGQSNLCINHFLLTNLHYCTWLDYRWEEERATDGSKWRFLEHKGPVMAAPYEPLPSKVRFFYDGNINTQVLLFLWHLVHLWVGFAEWKWRVWLVEQVSAEIPL